MPACACVVVRVYICDALSALCVCIQFDKYMAVLSRFKSPSGPRKSVPLLTYQACLNTKV